MAKVNIIAPCIVFLCFFLVQPSQAAYNVVAFGAKPDGRTDSTKAFLRAWQAACSTRKPVTVYVPRGTFLIKNVRFEGPCRSRMALKIDGKIVAPTNYWYLGNSGDWILFNKVNRLSIYGGIIDARGKGYWKCKRSGSHCPPGARSISFAWSNNVLVSGLTSMNSQMMNIAINHCKNVRIQNVRLRSPSGSPNTDGIHMQSSSGITITRSSIMTGDDCISVGQGSRNVWIERISCGPGHGISIGSLGSYSHEEGVQNITVTSSVFTKTQNGVRIKSWARNSNGFARNIRFRNLIMNRVSNPIIIDQNYCPHGSCPHQGSGVKISGVTYQNIRGTSTTRVAMSLDCSWRNPCTGIRMRNIKLTFFNRRALTYCRNAHGKSYGNVQPRSCF